MNREETIKLFTRKLRKKEPFSFVKIGDDCVFCMQGVVASNAEQHPYGPQLADHLKEAKDYLSKQSDAVVAEWATPEFDALLLHEDRYLTKNLRRFYWLLKNDSRPKYYFARERMREAARVFNMTFMPVPFPDSYSYFNRVKYQVKQIARPNIIILFSCGMLSKVMVYECHKMLKEMTVIDLGSAFDPLFVGDTRANDAGQHFKVKKFYHELLQN